MAGRRVLLEVIKGGVVIETVTLIAEADLGNNVDPAGWPLVKEFVVGRDAETCDLAFLHGSISRKHAVLKCEVQREGKYIWVGSIQLKDMNSANGSFVNKRKLSGGVATALQPGDVIRFGESTRLYHVVCDFPTHAPQSINVERTLQDAGYAPQGSLDSKHKGNVTRGDKKVAPLSGREKKLQAKIEAKQDKIEKIEVECQRIEAKESAHGELTEGQEKQLQMNRERLEKLKEELEVLNDELELAGERRVEGGGAEG